MAWSAVQLNPGVDTQKTLSANQAGVSLAQAIRYKENLIQTIGGWQNYVSFTVNSTVRDLHPWQDVNGVPHLAVAGTGQLAVITAGSPSEVWQVTLIRSCSFCSPANSVSIATCVICVCGRSLRAMNPPIRSVPSR